MSSNIGIQPTREKLVEIFSAMLDHDLTDRDGSVYVPPSRLLVLLDQALAYQVSTSAHVHETTARISSILYDYEAVAIPSRIETIYQHQTSVKIARFLEDGRVVTGATDCKVRIWGQEGCLEMVGHTSRIWDVATSTSHGRTLVYSGSGDGTVKVWDLAKCIGTLVGGERDVYSVSIHPSVEFLVSGGYDRVVRLWDVERGMCVKTFSGHGMWVSRTTCTPSGNLIVSGSKDNSIKFWDVVSGLCVKTLTAHLGEVTSVEMSRDGLYLLSSAKDNSNRLWDVRMLKMLKKFKGHTNTSRNFIKASFAGESLIIGGSEDGIVYVWDRESGEVLRRLRGHEGVVYGAHWGKGMVTCGDDGKVGVWTHELGSIDKTVS